MFAQCDGIIENIIRGGNNVATCSSEWVMVTDSFDPATLDPLLIAGAVGAGYFVLLPLWAAGVGVKYLLHAIKTY